MLILEQKIVNKILIPSPTLSRPNLEVTHGGSYRPERLEPKHELFLRLELELLNRSDLVPSWYWIWKTVPSSFQVGNGTGQPFQNRYNRFGIGTILHDDTNVNAISQLSITKLKNSYVSW